MTSIYYFGSDKQEMSKFYKSYLSVQNIEAFLGVLSPMKYFLGKTSAIEACIVLDAIRTCPDAPSPEL